MRRLNSILLIVILPFLFACAWTRPERLTQAQATTQPSVTPTQSATSAPQSAIERRAQNIPYDTLPGIDPKLTSLDIYAPASGEGLPVMIYVHGGGWSIGDKGRVQLKPQAFNQQGFVFISANYPLVPDVTVTDQATELARAVAWVHEHAGQFGGDPKRIFLMGHSAGAHLVSLVGTDPAYLEQAGVSLQALSGVVALDTRAYDISRMFKEETTGQRIYERAFGNDPANWAKLSPLTYVQSGSRLPPFAVAYSGQGQSRSTMAADFVQQIQTFGGQAVLIPGDDQTHAEINQQFGQPGDAVTEAVMAFLADILASQ